MSLRVVEVPNPAAGHDWQTVVPGQYVYNIVGITAQLTTPVNPAAAPDTSGNGRPLTYTNNQWTTYGVTGPFAGSPNGAVNQAAGASLHPTQIGTRAPSTDWNVPNLSVGGFVSLAGVAQGEMWTADNVLGNAHHGWRFDIDGSFGNNQLILQWRAGGAAQHLGNVGAGWHLVGVTYDGTNARGYVDGALAATVVAAAAVDAVSEPMGLGGYGDATNNFPIVGSMAGWFVNAGVIAPARWATYYSDATTVGAAQYAADVLADGPLALWMLDDTVARTTRTVALQITNGSSVIGDYPAPFPVVAVPGPITYSWQTALSSSAQTPSGATTTVAIPDLILPAGYTIGTSTLDLVATDQWSNINVWWDDGAIGPAGPLGPFSYPPGAHLVYRQKGT